MVVTLVSQIQNGGDPCISKKLVVILVSQIQNGGDVSSQIQNNFQHRIKQVPFQIRRISGFSLCLKLCFDI